ELRRGARHGRRLRPELVARPRPRADLPHTAHDPATKGNRLMAVSHRSSPLRVAVVGLGYWGPNLARNFQELEEAQLVTLCDLDADRLAAIGRRYPRVRRTTRFEDVLDDPRVEAVAIA